LKRETPSTFAGRDGAEDATLPRKGSSLPGKPDRFGEGKREEETPTDFGREPSFTGQANLALTQSKIDESPKPGGIASEPKIRIHRKSHPGT